MSNLSKLYRQRYSNYLMERKSKKIKYDMQHVNGGFSDGVEIGIGSDASKVNVKIDIYGGSNNTVAPYPVPRSIRDLQDAYIAAKNQGDPVTPEIKSELESYYKNLRKAISLEVLELIKNFDKQVKESVDRTVSTYNSKFK